MIRKIAIILLLTSCATTHTPQPTSKIDSVPIVSNATTAINVAYGFNGNMAYSPLSYSDALLNQKIHSINFEWARFPGGGNSWSYDWHTGMSEGEFPNTLQDVKALQLPVCVVLNGLRSLPDQIQMLDSLNRMGVKFRIEMFNEINNIGNAGKIKYPNATAYALAAKTWITEIKKKYPSVLIGIVGGNKGYKEARNWNQEVYKLVGQFDAWILHEYADPDLYARNGIADLAKLDKVLQTDISMSGLKAYDKPVWVTEYNWKFSDKQGDNKLNDASQEAVTTYMSKRIPELLPQTEIMLVNNIVSDKQGVFAVTKNSVTRMPTGDAMYKLLNQ